MKALLRHVDTALYTAIADIFSAFTSLAAPTIRNIEASDPTLHVGCDLFFRLVGGTVCCCWHRVLLVALERWHRQEQLG